LAGIIGIIRRTPPGLALLLMAPVLGELVSAHQTPLEFINPMNFLILSLPYGCGALVCRELTVRWNKGWPSLLALAMAYGIFEEGIVVYSLFDPNWSELGLLARYGFAGGVNWTWALLTIHFHTLISIGSSIVLTEIIYSDRRHERWLGGKALAVCIAGLLLWIPVMGLIMILDMGRPFPPWGWYAAAWIVVAALVFTARRLPHRPFVAGRQTVPRPIYFLLLGLINMTVFFLTVFLTPEYDFPPLAVTVLCLIVFDAASAWTILRWSGYGQSWDDRHRLALIAGMLGFFIYFCFDKDVKEWTGTSLVGVATILSLWQLSRIVSRRQ
jgi:hypothetical protein